MEACLDGKDVDEAIDAFFSERYGETGPAVRELMENTEDIQRRIFYLNDYYLTKGSRFPRLNHSKNHFYFEMMKEEHFLESGEWFIPKNWERGSIEAIREENSSAVSDSKSALKLLGRLKGKISALDYDVLENKFCNLYHISLVWQNLTEVFFNYAKHFELRDEKYEKELEKALASLQNNHYDAYAVFGDDFYINALKIDQLGASNDKLPISSFIEDVSHCFALEKSAIERL